MDTLWPVAGGHLHASEQPELRTGAFGRNSALRRGGAAEEGLGRGEWPTDDGTDDRPCGGSLRRDGGRQCILRVWLAVHLPMLGVLRATRARVVARGAAGAWHTGAAGVLFDAGGWIDSRGGGAAGRARAAPGIHEYGAAV